MSTLVYLVVFGNEIYKEFADLTIASLKKTGYSGDIVVLSDTDYKFEGARTIVFKEPSSNLYDLCMYRAKILEFASGYDRYLYLDTDVIAVKSIDRLFTELEVSEDPLIFLTPIELNKRNYKWYGGALYSQEETIQEKVKPMCAGIFAFNKSNYDFLENWKTFYTDRKQDNNLLSVNDQSALNSMVYLGIDNIGIYDSRYIYYPKYQKEEGKDTILIHHCAKKDVKSKLKYLRERIACI
jgi:lipopolysaccharide biosynthesis glycosyltransferase